MKYDYMFYTRPVHIDTIRAGDVVDFEGRHRTVSAKDLKHCSFMGRSLFGDTYRLGRLPVQLVTIYHARPGVVAMCPIP